MKHVRRVTATTTFGAKTVKIMRHLGKVIYNLKQKFYNLKQVKMLATMHRNKLNNIHISQTTRSDRKSGKRRQKKKSPRKEMMITLKAPLSPW